jgi:dCTP deaminase
MSFWSSQTLGNRLPAMITPFKADQIESASYELCVGREMYISPLPNTEKDDRKKLILTAGMTEFIPPGQFAYLITDENIKIPQNVIAFISIKFGAKSKGLINVSGFHVDPGYNGRLIFAVYNAGPLNFHVEYLQRLFTIWFADLDQVDAKARKKPGFNSIPVDILNNPDLVSSLPYLENRMKNLESKLEEYSIKQAFNYFATTSLLITIVGGLVAGIVLAAIPFIFSIYSGWISGQSHTQKPTSVPTSQSQPATTGSSQKGNLTK